MASQTAQIAAELAERRKGDHLLSPEQYELLRLRGWDGEAVKAFEKLLQEEIRPREERSQVFIAAEWVKYRIQGCTPDQIEYDWVHAIR